MESYDFFEKCVEWIEVVKCAFGKEKGVSAENKKGSSTGIHRKSVDKPAISAARPNSNRRR